MITILMHAGVAERSRSQKSKLQIPHEAGLTVADLVSKEGFPGEEAALLMVMINSEHAEMENIVRDGDVVDLILPIGGGG